MRKNSIILYFNVTHHDNKILCQSFLICMIERCDISLMKQRSKISRNKRITNFGNASFNMKTFGHKSTIMITQIFHINHPLNPFSINHLLLGPHSLHKRLDTEAGTTEWRTRSVQLNKSILFVRMQQYMCNTLPVIKL